MFVSHRPYFQLCTLLTLLTLPWMEAAKLLATTNTCMLMDQNLHLHPWRLCKGPDTYTHLPSGHLHLQILQLNRSQTQLALRAFLLLRSLTLEMVPRKQTKSNAFPFLTLPYMQPPKSEDSTSLMLLNPPFSYLSSCHFFALVSWMIINNLVISLTIFILSLHCSMHSAKSFF